MVTAQFTFQSGRPYSAPLFLMPNNSAAYSQRNEFRIPNFHKLDLGIIYTPKTKLKQSWQFNLYNAYNRQNVYAIVYELDSKDYVYKFRQFTAFPILPSLSYSIKF